MKCSLKFTHPHFIPNLFGRRIFKIIFLYILSQFRWKNYLKIGNTSCFLFRRAVACLHKANLMKYSVSDTLMVHFFEIVFSFLETDGSGLCIERTAK